MMTEVTKERKRGGGDRVRGVEAGEGAEVEVEVGAGAEKGLGAEAETEKK